MVLIMVQFQLELTLVPFSLNLIKVEKMRQIFTYELPPDFQVFLWATAVPESFFKQNCIICAKIFLLQRIPVREKYSKIKVGRRMEITEVWKWKQTEIKDRTLAWLWLAITCMSPTSNSFPLSPIGRWPGRYLYVKCVQNDTLKPCNRLFFQYKVFHRCEVHVGRKARRMRRMQD